MNTKSALTAILGTIAGLFLAMGTVAFAQDTGHMGNTQATGMMGQYDQQTTRAPVIPDSMHGKTVKQDTSKPINKNIDRGMHTQSTQPQRPVSSHHAGYSQTGSDYPCHADIKNGSKS